MVTLHCSLPTRPPGWWRWPLPALGVWALAWLVLLGCEPLVGGSAAMLAGLSVCWGLSLRQNSSPRRLCVAVGFPLSVALAGGTEAWPAWVWLLPCALLLALYPLKAWRDAPMFPTPPGALDALAVHLPLPPGARVLDAGCGAGDGLRALRAAWPAARLEGIEWSWPLTLLSRLRCPQAVVRRGDMWRDGSWSGLSLVYLFQRPESMARAWDKACAEMPGGWLVSLEFTVPQRPADLVCPLPGGRAVQAWRVPGASMAQPCVGLTDNTR